MSNKPAAPIPGPIQELDQLQRALATATNEKRLRERECLAKEQIIAKLDARISLLESKLTIKDQIIKGYGKQLISEKRWGKLFFWISVLFLIINLIPR